MTAPGGDPRPAAGVSRLTPAIRTPIVPGACDVPAAVLNPDRLTAVAQTGLLDTGPEPIFEELVQLARDVVRGEHAFFTVVDGRRSFWKTVIGPITDGGAGGGGVRESPVEDSLCKIVVAEDAPLIVDNAAADARVRDLPTVTALGMGACATFPIHDQAGHVLGGLCVTTTQPRIWTERHQRMLSTLAHAVSTEVQLRVALSQARAQVGELRQERDHVVSLAQLLQQVLLPPQLPDIPGLDVAAAYLPAGDGVVVGDFYDLFEGGDAWWAVMGDVCGHGLPAARTTALARYTLRTEAGHPGVDPDRVLRRLHHALRGQADGVGLATAVVARFAWSGDELVATLASAGHEPPLILRADGSTETPPAHGQMLGVTADPDLCQVPIRLSPGDALILLTDGVTEARASRGGELFDEQRLHHTLQRGCGLSAEHVVDTILDAVVQHSDGMLSDDAAVMAIRVPERPFPHTATRS